MKINNIGKKVQMGVALAAALLAPACLATVTTEAWYRGGENDPGASIGSTVTSMIDSSNSLNMTVHGSPLWAATSVTGSSMAYQFNGVTDYGTRAVASLATNNVGIEAWVRSASTSDGTAFGNGDVSWDGYGLIQYQGAWHGLFGSVALIGSAPIVTGVWQHVALVEDNGLATFYVNGVSMGTAAAHPLLPANGTGLGAREYGADFFNGAVDEARIFTFAPGQFSVNDLLYPALPIPEPSLATLLGLGGLLAWWQRRRVSR